MNDWLVKAELPPSRRAFAVSDIHGHGHLLKEALETCGFGGEDILVVVGDMIERGPDSLGTLRYVMELCKRYTVFAVAGNWENYCLRLLDDRTKKGTANLFSHLVRMREEAPGNLFDEAFAELGTRVDNEQALEANRDRLVERIAPELAFLRALPIAVETPHYVFVHGGLPEGGLGAVEPENIYSQCLKVDAFISRGYAYDKYVVVGHWPVVLNRREYLCHDPYVAEEQKIVGIDGGCGIKADRQVNLLHLPPVPDGKFSFTAADGFPTGTALDRQEEAASPLWNYMDNPAIRILEEAGDVCHVEHLGKGMRGWVFTDQIWRRDGKLFCECSNYHPGVEPGERLAVVRATSRGYWVKKRGVCGWYRGSLRMDSPPDSPGR